MRKGFKVLISRPEHQTKEFREGLERIGATVIEMPLIELKSVKDLQPLHEALNKIEEIDWLVFTSANAVDFFFKAAHDFGVKFYFYPVLKIATVGEKTKQRLEQLGYRTNFVPIQYTAEVLAENMDEDIAGKKVLIPRSALATDEYLRVFEKRGAKVLPVTLYENHKVYYSESAFNEKLDMSLDYLTFTSGSAVEAFESLAKEYGFSLSNEKIICIGPSTAKVAEQLGYKVEATAEEHTVLGMIQEIKKIEENV